MRTATGLRSCQDQPMAQSEPESPEYQLGDAVIDAMRGALRILGGTVQMAAGMTRLLAIAVLKAAAAAEKAAGASEADEGSQSRSVADGRPEEPGSLDAP